MTDAIPLLPTWPNVRCDVCRTVYEHPDASLEGAVLIVGKCPKCGGGTFSTTMIGTPTFGSMDTLEVEKS